MCVAFAISDKENIATFDIDLDRPSLERCVVLWILMKVVIIPVVVVLLGGAVADPETQKMLSIRRVLRKNGLLGRREE